MQSSDDAILHDAIRGLRNGDFSRLEPLFIERAGGKQSQFVEWCERGLLDSEPDVLAEGLSCACFNGRIAAATYLLERGVDPAAGDATGVDALNGAASRGQLEAVRLLLRWKAPLEARNRFGGTVLGATIWCAFHEQRPDHLQIIEELLQAGARVDAVEYPTGNAVIDAVLQKHGGGAKPR